jgi:hypothetical protein
MADGICPNCGRDIYDHDATERKACHDAVSGYRRPLRGKPILAVKPIADDPLAAKPILAAIPIADECHDTDGDGDCPICVGGRWRCPKKPYRHLRPDPDDPGYYAGREFGLPDPWD